MPKYHVELAVAGGVLAFDLPTDYTEAEFEFVLQDLKFNVIPKLEQIVGAINDATAKADRQREAGTPQGAGAAEEAKTQGEARSQGTSKEATEGVG